MPLIDMATVLSQVPLMQNAAGAQQSIAAGQQAAIEQAVQQAFEHQKDQVQKIEKSDALEAASKDREKDKSRQHASSGRKGPERELSQQATETTASNASPWSGNIIDVKI